MAIRVVERADPNAANPESSVLAASPASSTLMGELRRYCNREMRGCSVLVAGLRGSGKTTVVEVAIQELIRQSRMGDQPHMRPLMVLLQGPVLLPTVPPKAPPPPAPPRKPDRSPTTQVTHQVTVIGGAASPPPAPPAPPPPEDEQVRQRILELFALGLHAALSRELVDGLRRQGRSVDPDLEELAAEVEIRLPEGPSPSQLREYWRQAGVLDTGVLFPHRPAHRGGMLELAAASGIGYAYQRVSGSLKARHEQQEQQKDSVERQSRRESALVDLARPLSALAAGALVTAGTASQGVWQALLLGALTAAGAGAVFRFTRTRSREESIKRDYTFLPDTRPETLDRVLPELIRRLKRAGLAPVVVVDELDKVDDLWARHHDLLNHFKKLFAENVFTCLLVNRDFVEALESAEQRAPFGRGFSYFTRRTFVSYTPKAIHDYLAALLRVEHG